MFLSRFGIKEQDVFVELALHMSNADGVISDEERAILSACSDEMGRSIDVDPDNLRNIDDVLKETDGFSQSVKKMILFELAGIAYCDVAEDVEMELMKKIADKFAVSADENMRIQKAVEGLYAVYKEINELIK